MVGARLPAPAMYDPISSNAETAAADDALRALLEWLAAQDYHFVTPTPATHAGTMPISTLLG